METSMLDFRNFAWLRKSDKTTHAVLGLTDFQTFDVVVYREWGKEELGVMTVADFCQEFEATYQVP